MELVPVRAVFTPANPEPPEVTMPEIGNCCAGAGPPSPPPPPPLQLPRQMARKQDVINIRIRPILNTARRKALVARATIHNFKVQIAKCKVKYEWERRKAQSGFKVKMKVSRGNARRYPSFHHSVLPFSPSFHPHYSILPSFQSSNLLFFHSFFSSTVPYGLEMTRKYASSVEFRST